MRRTWPTILLAAALLAAVPVQDTGSWQVLFTGDGEVLLAISTAEFRGDDRPIVYVHCKAGNARVVIKPAPRILRLQFDEGSLFQGRYVDQSFGFATDDDGRLVEHTVDTGVPPLKVLADSARLIESMQQSDRLYMRAGPGAERNHFELRQLGWILEQLRNPCAATE